MANKTHQQLHTNDLHHPTNPEAIHQYYLNIIRSMPNNVYWLDKNCITQGCNDNVLKMLGLTRLEDFIGINYEQMGKIGNWIENQAKSFQRDDMEVMASGKSKINVEEPPIYDEKGNPLYYVSTRVPLFDQDRNVIGVVGISADITERKKMEEELRISKAEADNANKAKSEFITNMSHDLRTPLVGIVSMAKKILDNTKESDTQKAAHYLIQSSHILLNLLNQVIEFSKSESGELPVADIRFNPKNLMENLNKLFVPAAHSKHLELLFDYAPNIPDFVIGDKDRLYRILLNLIGNAIKFTDQGLVEVSIKMAESQHSTNGLMLIFSVKDTGIGIPKEKQEIIFSKFSKISPSYTGIYKGYGLGLFTVKKLLYEIDGRILLNSKPNHGSLFTIEIPVEKDLYSGYNSPEFNDEACNIFDNKSLNSEIEILLASLSTSKSEVEVTSLPSFVQISEYNNYTVLLVEDNMIARLGVLNEINKLNCKVDIAENGAEALSLANKNDYDLIIMDIGLPDKDGIQVASEIRENANEGKSNKHTPIVALTAHVDQAEEIKCLQAGMNKVLQKPLNENQLKEIFWQYIHTKEATNLQSLTTSEACTINQYLPIIDWEFMKSTLGYNMKQSKELLDLFMQLVPKFEKDAEQAYKAADWKQLKFYIRKFYGGSQYCSIPRVRKSLEQLALLCSQDTSILSVSRKKIDYFYQQLMQEIKKLTHEYEILILHQ